MRETHSRQYTLDGIGTVCHLFYGTRLSNREVKHGMRTWAAGSGDQPSYRSPAPSGQCGRRFTAEAEPARKAVHGPGWRLRRRMGPASFAQASAEAKPRQETPCEGEGQGREAAGNAARSKGERGWSTVRKGESRGKRASATPGSPARGDRGRMGQQAKNDFLPCWPPAPGARSVQSPVRSPSEK